MTESPKLTPMSEGQRAFAKARLHYLERLLNLFKIGTVGVKKVREELQAEATNFRLQIAADDNLVREVPPTVPGLPAGAKPVAKHALEALRPFADFGKSLVAMAVPGSIPLDGEAYTLMHGNTKSVLTIEHFRAAIALFELVGGEP